VVTFQNNLSSYSTNSYALTMHFLPSVPPPTQNFPNLSRSLVSANSSIVSRLIRCFLKFFPPNMLFAGCVLCETRLARLIRNLSPSVFSFSHAKRSDCAHVKPESCKNSSSSLGVRVLDGAIIHPFSCSTGDTTYTASVPLFS